MARLSGYLPWVRYTFYLVNTHDFNPWSLEGLAGVEQVVFFDPTGFAAELVLEAEVDGLIRVAEQISSRLDLDGWPLSELAALAARKRKGPVALTEGFYARELAAQVEHARDWPFGLEYDVDENGGEIIFRSGSLVLRGRATPEGDEVVAAVAYPNAHDAQAAFKRLNNESLEAVFGPLRGARDPRTRLSGLAERR